MTDRNDNQEMEPDCYGNFDLDSSFSASVPLQTPYDRQNYPSQYLTDSLYNRNADMSDQDQDLTNRNTFYKGQMAFHINQLGSNVPPERLQTRNMLSNESSITKYQLSSLYKDAIHKGNNLLYRRPANTNLNQKTIDQNHRFGQVVAWTNPQNKTSSPNSGSEWSGSDNDLLSIDDKMSSSCKENSGTTNSKFLEQRGGKSPTQILKPEIHQQLHTLPADTYISKSLHQQVLKEIQPKEPSQKYLPMNNLKPDSHPLLSTLKENQIRKQCKPGAPCPNNQKPKSSFNFFTRKDQDLAVDTEDEQDRFNSIFDGIF